jgi:hypothetical protein
VQLRFPTPEAPVAQPPDMRRGPPLVAWDFRATPPPDCASRTLRWGSDAGLDPHPDGTLYFNKSARTATLRDGSARLRDASVTLSFSALDPGARVGVAVRHEPIGAAAIVYVFDLVAGTGTAFLARLVVTPEASEQTSLSVRKSPGLRPLGQRNEIELRSQGAWLVGYVNDLPVVSAFDPAYGIGCVGIRVGREPDAAEPVTRVVLHGGAVHFMGGAR